VVNPICDMPYPMVQGASGLSPNMSKGKKRMDVYLSEDQEKLFKEHVFKRKGMKKGNISEAVQEAILLWVNAEPATQGKKTK